MDDQPAKRRGRPRATIPDALGAQGIPGVSGEHLGEREAGADHAPEQADSWLMLTKIAENLSEAGRIVTQIHTKGQAKPWQWWDVGCATFSNSDGDYVVTTDGRRHTL